MAENKLPQSVLRLADLADQMNFTDGAEQNSSSLISQAMAGSHRARPGNHIAMKGRTCQEGLSQPVISQKEGDHAIPMD